MKYKNKVSNLFLLLTVAVFGFACQTQQAEPNNANTPPKTVVKAKTPTEAYQMLYAACKAKDSEKIRQLMSRGSIALAGMSASQQKKSLDQILENGLVAPTLAPAITEIRDERVKDNFGAIEVFNPKDNRFEDLPFIFEDGGWKLAVGELFSDTWKSPGKGQGQIEMEASNKMMPMPSNGATNFPQMTNGNKSVKDLPAPDGVKSVEVPKETKPKQ